MSVTIQRPDTNETLTFDSALEQWSPTVRVTEHPVEDGESVSDHAQVMPLIYRVRGTITESPFDPAEQGGGGQGLTNAAREFLQGIQGVPVVIFTEREGILDYMMLISHPYSVDSVRRVVFDCTFRQVRLGEVSFVVLPVAEVEAGITPEVDAGKQSVTEQTVEEARGGSALYDIAQSLGVL